MSYITHLLKKRPIIPAIKEISDLKDVPAEDKIVVLLHADISELSQAVEWAEKEDKLIFLHLDLARGIGKDREGIKYLADEIGIDGIVTTKNYLIKYAKEFNLTAIQRLFLLDSAAVKTGIKRVQESSPDLVEVLPGVIISHVPQLQKLTTPIIAGGLINTEEEIDDVLESGAIGISTSDPHLWIYNRK
mgnify:CR=1 FL=1